MVSNIILVDSSYTSFYRFFATLRWFSFSNKEIYSKYKDDPSYDWSMEPLFIDKYKKMYLDSIKNLVSPTVFNSSIIIFCLDSPQSTLWRHEFSTCYKGNRVDMSEKYNIRPTFNLTYNELIPNLVKENNNIFMIKQPRMEADDIIALGVRYIKNKKPNYNVYLVSGDNDFLQLGYNNLYFADYKKKELFQLSKEESKEALKQKIINGDCSDNIPSIFIKEDKISNKRRKLIREDDNELMAYLKEYNEAYSIYRNNKKLIDFKNIPKDLRPPVYKIIKKIILNK
jgi:5'-3' exonuclease